MESRFWLFVAILFVNVSLFGQGFNIVQKAHVGGMPGNEYNDIWGYVDSQGREYAIIGSSQAINIYDVTDCANPIHKWTHIDGSTVTWRDFKTYQNYAYGVCDGGACTEGLEIINLDNFTFTQQTNVFTRAHNIFVDTAYARLYVVGSNAGGLLIYSLNNPAIGATPANPVLIRNFNTTYIHDIYVRNNIAYASHGYNGLFMWDVTDVNNIQMLASIDVTIGYNHSSWLNGAGTHIFSAEEVPRGMPIQVYEIAGSGISTSLSHVKSFKEPLEVNDDGCRPHNPFVKGDSLFISYYEDGLQVFDISNPIQPKRIAWFDSYTAQNGLGYNLSQHDWKGQWGTYPFLPSGCILMSDITQGLYTLKLDIPVNDGIFNVEKVTETQNAGLYFDNHQYGLVLTSPKGDCYRVIVNTNGTVAAERIVCFNPSLSFAQLEKNDLAITFPRKGLILKDVNQTCREIRVNTSGNLYSQQQPFCPDNESNMVRISDADLFVKTYTKGIILRGDNEHCYKVTVNNLGSLIVQQLPEFP
jgi:choice-of-anchor B domain-containing protein